ncbi:MAG: hypothetical protein J0I07_34315 [Myxococcales bacterium]|nr:hypothetical protein [Myxococcales bacterium]
MSSRREHRAAGSLHHGDDQDELGSPSPLSGLQTWNLEADASFVDVA